MSTFEEQFPSLKHDIGMLKLPENISTEEFYDSSAVRLSVILDHCLDKQKVREVLMKKLERTDYQPVVTPIIHELIKELGL